MNAADEMDKKQLERDLFGEGEEPLSENQYRAVKCIVDERDAAEEKIREVVGELDGLADLLADSGDVPVNQTPAVRRLNEILAGL